MEGLKAPGRSYREALMVVWCIFVDFASLTEIPRGVGADMGPPLPGRNYEIICCKILASLSGQLVRRLFAASKSCMNEDHGGRWPCS